MLVRKVLATNTQYAMGMLIGNIFLIVQALVAVFAGLYFNEITHMKTAAELFIYYSIGLAFFNPIQRGNIVRRIDEEVEMGDVAVHFTKPYNFFLHMIVKDLAQKAAGIAITAVVTITLLAIIIGPAIPTLEQTGRALIIIPLTIGFIYLNNGIFAQMALFWESAGWFVAIWGVSSFFLGGGLLPLEFLPSFASYIPPAFFFGAPLQYVLTGAYPLFWLFCVYVVMLVIINYLVHRYVRKRMQINGG